MKMYCQNRFCDFEFEDDPTAAVLLRCPQCGGMSFGKVKEEKYGEWFVARDNPFDVTVDSLDSSSLNWSR